MKSFSSVVVILLFYGCVNSSNINLIKPNYYDIIGDSYNDMTLWFHVKKDSVFCYYCNVLDNGNYLNCPDGSTDYAGSFPLIELQDSMVQFKIKNYRYDDYYRVSLIFHSKGDGITWKIDSGNVGYLPKTAEFITRESKDSLMK